MYIFQVAAVRAMLEREDGPRKYAYRVCTTRMTDSTKPHQNRHFDCAVTLD